MSNMFSDADSFNQDISSWNVSRVTDMRNMFANADNFNQDISSWNVSRVTDISYMFSEADSFNQDISIWVNYISENIIHNNFSSGSCPLDTVYHPFSSWND